MYFSHSRVFVQTAFFCHFVFHFLFSNAFQRDNNSDTVYVTGYIYMSLALLGVVLTLSWAQNVFVLTKK